jgi:hypothetical protein
MKSAMSAASVGEGDEAVRAWGGDGAAMRVPKAVIVATYVRLRVGPACQCMLWAVGARCSLGQGCALSGPRRHGVGPPVWVLA